MAEVDIITLMMSIQAVYEQIKKYEALLISETLRDPEEIQSLIFSYEKAADALENAYNQDWHEGSNLPKYFADISAQFKIFVDRCYSYLEPFETMPKASRLKAGKKFVLITAQNRGEDMFAEVCTKYRMIFEFLGFKETHLIRGCDLMKADALKTKNRQDLIELSMETARKVVQLTV